MIQFTDEQIEGFSREEKALLNDLAERHNIEIPKPLDDERKRIEEEQKAIRKRIEERLAKERDDQNYAEWMESQLDTNGNKPTTQYF